MVKSMTGFGRYEEADENVKIVIEIKSVNHRYCEMSVKAPKKLSYFEASIRTLLKNYVTRGKIDIFISYEDYTQNDTCVRYNKEHAATYYRYLKEICDDFNLDGKEISATTIAKFPDVLTTAEKPVAEDKLWEMLSSCINKAAIQFVESRKTEGQNLKKDICSKLDYMKELVIEIEKRSPEIVSEYRTKLMNKVSELLGDNKVDEAVLATEITIFADKICVDEETVRLASHIDAMQNALESGESGVGRKLDFIAQEMNREANTILSKANDISVSDYAISLKTEIEKIREQIQNIE